MTNPLSLPYSYRSTWLLIASFFSPDLVFTSYVRVLAYSIIKILKNPTTTSLLKQIPSPPEDNFNLSLLTCSDLLEVLVEDSGVLVCSAGQDLSRVSRVDVNRQDALHGNGIKKG